MLERKSYPITELTHDDATGVIEAFVSVFNNVDAGKEIVRQGFFQKSIERKLPKGVWAHDWKQPIAKTLEAKEVAPGDPSLPDNLKTLGGTYIKGQFNMDTQRGREAYSDIKFGIIDEFSIGYSVVRESKDEDTGARELLEGDWKEWSPVLVGMNDQTQLVSIKSEDAGTESSESFDSAVAELEKFAQKMQRNHDNRVKEGRVLSGSNRAKVQAAYDALGTLLEASAPPAKQTDMDALRTQFERMRHQLFALTV
jgi:HK97 family phage prohead protease